MLLIVAFWFNNLQKSEFNILIRNKCIDNKKIIGHSDIVV